MALHLLCKHRWLGGVGDGLPAPRQKSPSLRVLGWGLMLLRVGVRCQGGATWLLGAGCMLMTPRLPLCTIPDS